MPSMPKTKITGPLKSYAPGFAAELVRLGYSTESAPPQLRLLAHLSRWVVETGRGGGPWTLQDIVVGLSTRSGPTVMI
jgi:hypothetical protein